MRDRRSLLVAALGFARLTGRAPELGLLHRWLDTWQGVGDVVVGMHRPGYDVQMIKYADHWRATFFPTGARAFDRLRERLGRDAVAGGATRGVGGRPIVTLVYRSSDIDRGRRGAYGAGVILTSAQALALLEDLDAFYTEHRAAGKIEGGVNAGRVWMSVCAHSEDTIAGPAKALDMRGLAPLSCRSGRPAAESKPKSGRRTAG